MRGHVKIAAVDEKVKEKLSVLPFTMWKLRLLAAMRITSV